MIHYWLVSNNGLGEAHTFKFWFCKYRILGFLFFACMYIPRLCDLSCDHGSSLVLVESVRKRKALDRRGRNGLKRQQNKGNNDDDDNDEKHSPRFDDDDQSFVGDVSRLLSELHDAPNHALRQPHLQHTIFARNTTTPN